MKKYTLGLYEKAMPNTLSWKEKLFAAKETGFDFVEISIDETDEKLGRLKMSKEERLELIKIMYETGIPIRTMCLSGHRKYPLGSSDPTVRCKGLEIMEQAIQLADDLGIRIIQLAGYDVYYEQSTRESKQWFEENLKKATQMAASMGVILGFETMETEFMNTVEKAMGYVKEQNSVYLKVYPDCGNLTNAALTYGTHVLDDLKMGEGNMAALHLKETLPGKFREIAFGMGHVEFKEIIQTALKLGICKYVAECWYMGKTEWMEELREVNDMFRGLLEGV